MTTAEVPLSSRRTQLLNPLEVQYEIHETLLIPAGARSEIYKISSNVKLMHKPISGGWGLFTVDPENNFRQYLFSEYDDKDTLYHEPEEQEYYVPEMTHNWMFAWVSHARFGDTKIELKENGKQRLLYEILTLEDLKKVANPNRDFVRAIQQWDHFRKNFPDS